jgi:hypothetical protein
MGMQEIINKIIKEIGARYGTVLPSLNNNICTMRYKDKINFVIEAPDAGSGVYFYSPVIEMTDENDERLHRMLLEQNFLYSSVVGTALSLDEQNGDVVLCQLLDEKGLDAEKFEKSIESFLSQAEKVREMLQNWMHGSDAQEAGNSSEAVNPPKLRPAMQWMA